MYIYTYSTDPTIARIANEFFSIFSGNRGLLALTNTPGTALLIERGLKAIKTFCSRCFNQETKIILINKKFYGFYNNI
jgi:hypothetical protein